MIDQAGFGADKSVPDNEDRDLGKTNTAEPTAVVVLDHVGFVYEGIGDQALRVLDSVELTIGAGEIVSLLGPSGSGKSTILNLIAGFIRPSSGTIIVGGRNVTAPGPDRPVVFQDPALFPWLSVLDNITLGPKKKGVPKNVYLPRAKDLLLKFGLKKFESYFPYQLSGGMKQRVQIARALMGEPEVLLMDEPFGALDSQTRLEMQQYLLSIRNIMSCAVLFITHDIDEAIFLGNRIYLLSRQPASIEEEFRVKLPSVRSRECLTDPEFVSLKGVLLSRFRYSDD